MLKKIPIERNVNLTKSKISNISPNLKVTSISNDSDDVQFIEETLANKSAFEESKNFKLF